MKTVNIYKAQGIADKKVESVLLQFNVEMPEFKSMQQSMGIFQSESMELADVLCSTLPGGTLDRLIAELLQRRATSFVVPLFEKKG